MRRIARDPGVVDEDPGRPEITRHAQKAGLAGIEVGNVPLVRRDRSLAAEPARRFLVAVVDRSNPKARVLQRNRNRAPNAARATGDNRRACHAASQAPLLVG